MSDSVRRIGSVLLLDEGLCALKVNQTRTKVLHIIDLLAKLGAVVDVFNLSLLKG